LEISAFFRQLFDGIAAIAKDPFVAVNVGDAADARGGVGVGRVVTHHPEVFWAGFDLAEVHGADGAGRGRDLVGLSGPVIGNAQRLAGHGRSLGFAGTCSSGQGIHRTKPHKLSMYTKGRSRGKEGRLGAGHTPLDSRKSKT